VPHNTGFGPRAEGRPHGTAGDGNVCARFGETERCESVPNRRGPLCQVADGSGPTGPCCRLTQRGCRLRRGSAQMTRAGTTTATLHHRRSTDMTMIVKADHAIQAGCKSRCSEPRQKPAQAQSAMSDRPTIAFTTVSIDMERPYPPSAQVQHGPRGRLRAPAAQLDPSRRPS
jgi:hypothetical protein